MVHFLINHTFVTSSFLVAQWLIYNVNDSLSCADIPKYDIHTLVIV